jgi:hypothetical protein
MRCIIVTENVFQDVRFLLQLWNIMLRLCLLVLAVLRNITLSSCSSNNAVTVAVANRTKMGVTWARDTLLNSVSGTILILLVFLLCIMSRIPLLRMLWSLKIKFEMSVSVFVETAEYFHNYIHYYTLHAACCRHFWDWIGPSLHRTNFQQQLLLNTIRKGTTA